MSEVSARSAGKKKIRRYGLLVVVLTFLTWYFFFALPRDLFSDPYSTVLEASNGNLLSAVIASDGQWRFPLEDSVPQKFADAVVTFEDKRFYDHPGIDPFSLGRALGQNLAEWKVVSGGSTITMQVIRLSRKGKSRNILEKLIEAVLATRLEMRYSKNEILSFYAAHAPFGGNVVGLRAACWRYFGRDASQLSWSEAALLAVLPNSPSLIHPGRNRDLLKKKRDKLLDKLRVAGKIDSLTCSLAKEERLPEEPIALPRHAKHLMLRMAADGFSQKKLTSTIDENLQTRIEKTVADYHARMAGNQVHNAAAIILDVRSGNVLTYVGNVDAGPEHGDAVDMIAARRSTGSILKPFLYAAMQEDGIILPSTLIPDVPLMMEGFSPKNFSKQYDGAVAADQALIRSLNIPAVNELKEYHYEKFYQLLKDIGMTTLDRSSDHYGLSLILGGAEGTLYDIAGMYASMARTLNNYFEYAGSGQYRKMDFHPPQYRKTDKVESSPSSLEKNSFLSAASISITFKALEEVYRPGEETGWRYFHNPRRIAWKTGTSFGFRDAWAVGVTPRYVVGVWVGNADGEGRPGLTGTDAASPLMFEIFSHLPSTGWFQTPYAEMEKIPVCKKSGHRVTPVCENADSVFVVSTGLNTKPCPYHEKIHLSSDLKYRVHANCAPTSSIIHRSWFVLPPVQEFYFKSRNLSYKTLPPFAPGCEVSATVAVMEMLYPKENARIYIPRELNGEPGSAVLELAHRIPSSIVYWHLDGNYVGTTKNIHHFAIQSVPGKHILTIIDENGESLERHFEIISKM